MDNQDNLINYICTGCNTKFKAAVCACSPACPTCGKTTTVMTESGYNTAAANGNELNKLLQ